MRKNTYIFFLFFICLPFFLFSQDQQKINNLINRLNNACNIDRPEILNRLSETYLYVDADKALEYAKQALDYSQTQKNEPQKAFAFFNMGNALLEKNSTEDAIGFYADALRLSRKISDSMRIAAVYTKMGLAYDFLGEFDKAFNYFHQALKYEKELHNKTGISLALTNIGNIYSHWNNYSMATEYYKRAL